MTLIRPAQSPISRSDIMTDVPNEYDYKREKAYRAGELPPHPLDGDEAEAARRLAIMQGAGEEGLPPGVILRHNDYIIEDAVRDVVDETLNRQRDQPSDEGRIRPRPISLLAMRSKLQEAI